MKKEDAVAGGRVLRMERKIEPFKKIKKEQIIQKRVPG
jgi:hypothetical protein